MEHHEIKKLVSHKYSGRKTVPNGMVKEEFTD